LCNFLQQRTTSKTYNCCECCCSFLCACEFHGGRHRLAQKDDILWNYDASSIGTGTGASITTIDGNRNSTIHQSQPKYIISQPWKGERTMEKVINKNKMNRGTGPDHSGIGTGTSTNLSTASTSRSNVLRLGEELILSQQHNQQPLPQHQYQYPNQYQQLDEESAIYSLTDL
jgi:hypothetical protein